MITHGAGGSQRAVHVRTQGRRSLPYPVENELGHVLDGHGGFDDKVGGPPKERLHELSIGQDLAQLGIFLAERVRRPVPNPLDHDRLGCAQEHTEIEVELRLLLRATGEEQHGAVVAVQQLLDPVWAPAPGAVVSGLRETVVVSVVGRIPAPPQLLDERGLSGP